MEHRGEIVSREAIMTALVGVDSFVDENTLYCECDPPAEKAG